MRALSYSKSKIESITFEYTCSKCETQLRMPWRSINDNLTLRVLPRGLRCPAPGCRQPLTTKDLQVLISSESVNA